jgi:hypothetical protein
MFSAANRLHQRFVWKRGQQNNRRRVPAKPPSSKRIELKNTGAQTVSPSCTLAFLQFSFLPGEMSKT